MKTTMRTLCVTSSKMWIWLGSPNPPTTGTGSLLEGGAQIVPTTKQQYNSKNFMTMGERCLSTQKCDRCNKASIKNQWNQLGKLSFIDALQKDKRLKTENKQLLVMFERESRLNQETAIAQKFK